MPVADPRFHDFVLLQAQNAGLFLGQIPNPATGYRFGQNALVEVA